MGVDALPQDDQTVPVENHRRWQAVHVRPNHNRTRPSRRVGGRPGHVKGRRRERRWGRTWARPSRRVGGQPENVMVRRRQRRWGRNKGRPRNASRRRRRGQGRRTQMRWHLRRRGEHVNTLVHNALRAQHHRLGAQHHRVPGNNLGLDHDDRMGRVGGWKEGARWSRVAGRCGGRGTGEKRRGGSAGVSC